MSETFEHNGRTFNLEVEYDDFDTRPWEDDCGSGIVHEVSHRGRPDKSPGWRPLHDDRGTYWFYDMQASTELAKQDGWGLGPEALAELTAKLGREPSKGEIRAEAVERNFNHIRRWFSDQWFYASIGVTLLDAEGEEVGDTQYLGGVEYDYSDDAYAMEIARDLADEILKTRREEWRKALHEARQVRYWAERDVCTQ